MTRPDIEGLHVQRLTIKSLDGRFTKDSECLYVRCDWCNRVGIAPSGEIGHAWFKEHSERCLP